MKDTKFNNGTLKEGWKFERILNLKRMIIMKNQKTVAAGESGYLTATRALKLKRKSQNFRVMSKVSRISYQEGKKWREFKKLIHKFGIALMACDHRTDFHQLTNVS